MPRYIDADALKHELCIRQHMLNADSLWKTLEIMDAQPTADVVERKKGEWIPIGEIDADGNQYYNCSACQCGETHSPKVEVCYCWNCGADMREEINDEVH